MTKDEDQLRRALARLLARRRNIVLLNRVDGLSYSQIAEGYGISVWRVRRHVRVAMHVLILEVLHGQLQPWWRRWGP